MNMTGYLKATELDDLIVDKMIVEPIPRFAHPTRTRPSMPPWHCLCMLANAYVMPL